MNEASQRHQSDIYGNSQLWTRKHDSSPGTPVNALSRKRREILRVYRSQTKTPKPASTLTPHLTQNVNLGEGVDGQFLRDV